MLAADSERSWHRSSRCESGNCVEVAITDSAVLVRNSREPGVELTFARAEWAEFVEAIKRGELAG
ncbi:hypothetical protein GCM10023322_26040 [Rugosimonospora acidiphila]|uniref:DUF397 domain-containing protein n=1 Tax=Rugosimonospora acidiphila TaxID=556531 RepID=A0ABP9RRG8_9ACTN